MTIRIIPSEFNIANDVVNLPVYIIILSSTALGLLLGTLFEYSRTWRDRRISKKRLREVEKLNAKVKCLTTEKTSDTDEILGLLK